MTGDAGEFSFLEVVFFVVDAAVSRHERKIVSLGDLLLELFSYVNKSIIRVAK